MMYMFVSEKQVEQIKDKYKVDITQRPDVLVTGSLKEKPEWECRECGKEVVKVRRCDCGCYIWNKIVN